MEHLKKPYKPKADKVEKLTKVYAELKKDAPKVSPLFKGVAKVVFMAVFFSSCSANYHLKQAVRKNPNIITEKIIRQVDTLIIRDSVKTEHTYTTKSIDTLIIDNEHFKTTIYRYHDTIKLVQILKADTVRITQKYVSPVIEYRPWYEKYVSYLAFGLIALILFLWIRKTI